MNLNPLKDIQVETNAPLSKYTTFQLGGQAQSIITCETPQHLKTIVDKLNEEKLSFILIGGGSNIVVSDKGLDCHVIRYVSSEPLIKLKGLDIEVSGSTSFDALTEFAAENGLEGLHTCHGIPGTVGGAIVGNAGAYGKQIGDVVQSVALLTKSGDNKDVTKDDLDFSYRHSNLRESGDIVVSCRLKLQAGSKDELLHKRKAILQNRREKHPNLDQEPCAGSFFRNIEPTSKAGKRQATGWFLDKAGGKDLKSGGAYIFEKHANIIVKGDACTSQDVLDLQKKMATLAKDAHNLDLVREVKFVGEFDGKTSAEMIW